MTGADNRQGDRHGRHPCTYMRRRIFIDETAAAVCSLGGDSETGGRYLSTPPRKGSPAHALWPHAEERACASASIPQGSEATKMQPAQLCVNLENLHMAIAPLRGV